VATGSVHSFRDIAERIAAMYDPAVPVRGSPRKVPCPTAAIAHSTAPRLGKPSRFSLYGSRDGFGQGQAEHSQRM